MTYLKTFRDPLMSRWQSVVESVVDTDQGAAAAGTRPALSNPLVQAAVAVNAAVASGVELLAPPPLAAAAGSPPLAGMPPLAVLAPLAGAPAPASVPPAPAASASSGSAAPTPPVRGTAATVRTCADLAFQLLHARLDGEPADRIRRLEDALQFGACDPKWSEAVDAYLKYFVVEHETIPYRPAPADPAQLPPVVLKENATVALIADAGTGTPEAMALLEQVAAHQPDVVIHLGDIYYSGTQDECQKYFLDLCNQAFRRDAKPLPIFTMTGNHDMYAGGAGFYWLIDQLNKPPLAPPGQAQMASFFALRSSGWQLLAMDTGLHDSDVFDVATAETYLEDAELAWHSHWIDNAGGRRTILLSHHQLFSAFSAIGTEGDRSLNTRLLAQFGARLGKADAWFWGHEHNLEIYAPYQGLERGRCIGCAAIPVYVAENPYTSRVGNRIPLLPANPAVSSLPVMLESVDGVYEHAFAILKLDDAAKTAQITYYQTCGPQGTPLFTERIG
jgi:hypothetical protein